MSSQVSKEARVSTPREVQRELQREKGVPEKLIRKAVRGNKAALKKLCESIARHVTFRVARRLKSQADVEDVVQEILFRVCEGIRSLRDPKAFGGWLNTIINNETNRFLTQNKKHGVVISMDEYLDSMILEEEDDYLAFDYVMKEDERKAVIAIIDTLPERQLEAVMLYYYEGMTITETARAMGVTKQVISIHLARAKEKIRKVINKDSEYLERTGTTGGMAAMGAGALITQALIEESAVFPALSKSSVDMAVLAGLAKAKATSGLVGTASAKGLNTWLIGIVSTVAISAALVSIYYPSASPDGKEAMILTSTIPIITEGDIVFSDGETDLNTVNPHYAVVWATNDRGELFANRWWITRAENDTVLYNGAGASVDTALIDLQETGSDGIYTLWFEMEDREGATYTLQRQFTIETMGR